MLQIGGQIAGRIGGVGAALFVATVLVSASACGDLGPGEGQLAELELQQAKWRQLRPASYRYGVERLCFCGEDARGPVHVTVDGANVTARTYINSGDPVPAQFVDLFPSVDGLFDLLREALESDAHRVDVTYDPISGVPIDFFIDYQQMTADEELGFSVVESVRLPR